VLKEIAKPEARFTICRCESHSASPRGNHPAGVSSLPIAAAPRSLLQLDLLLSERVIDLDSVVNVIKSDIGLVVQLLRLASKTADWRGKNAMSISHWVVAAGSSGLRTLICQTASLTSGSCNRSQSLVRERFWQHARLTGLIAEDLGRHTPDSMNDEPLLATMMYQLSDLAQLLGWNAGMKTRELRQLAAQTATTWNLPAELVEVVRGERDLCSTAKTAALLDLARAANTWACRLESLAAHECGMQLSRTVAIE
jgi:HD-like signal output (HDOD) protein